MVVFSISYEILHRHRLFGFSFAPHYLVHGVVGLGDYREYSPATITTPARPIFISSECDLLCGFPSKRIRVRLLLRELANPAVVVCLISRISFSRSLPSLMQKSMECRLPCYNTYPPSTARLPTHLFFCSFHPILLSLVGSLQQNSPLHSKWAKKGDTRFGTLQKPVRAKEQTKRAKRIADKRHETSPSESSAQ